ncbi:MAG TPA: hypothetical protein VFA20_09590 [Myxococcaceae bacterium]|nr:hypothetical protein [Myxococcaceae bacterium]
MKRVSSSAWCWIVAVVCLAAAGEAAAVPSLAGVHWFYSGNTSLLDQTIPAGERGWNVEGVYDSNQCPGDLSGLRSRLQTAKNAGLVNILRIDYLGMTAVPSSSGAYDAWVGNFNQCVTKTIDLVNLFIVGNEPNIEGNIGAGTYAAAFNYLYARKPAGAQLLAVHTSPFTDPAWMTSMAGALSAVDGFAFHTGGARPGCSPDPRVACSYGGWPFDGAFRYYRNVINAIPSQWWSKPVYLTEFNTYTGDAATIPDVNYPTNWINQAFEDVRNYNAARGSKPRVMAMAWFVDQDLGGWSRFSLENGALGAARGDMGEEFKNCLNRTCQAATDNASSSFAQSPTFVMPGQISRIQVSSTNTGGTTWSGSGNGNVYRLGPTVSNRFDYTAFPQCGGYRTTTTDARVYTCATIAPNGSNSYQWDVRAPWNTTSATLSAQTVHDGVAWFGNSVSKTVGVGQASCGTALTQCILFYRPDVLTFYGNNGWNTSCPNRDAIVANWCGIDPAGCNGLKSGACSAFNNGSRCPNGKQLDGTPIDPATTFNGFKVCGMDHQQYLCGASAPNWTPLGVGCN